jgi:hypothetical protein
MSEKIHSAFALCEGIAKNNRAILMSSEWQSTVLEFSRVLMCVKIFHYLCKFPEILSD